MSTSVDVEPRVAEYVGTFRANAAEYAANRRIIDAAAKYDSLDDAKAALERVWTLLEKQIVEGAGYTPSADLGFGSDNGGQIASAIIGRRSSVTATRKAFANLGK